MDVVLHSCQGKHLNMTSKRQCTVLTRDEEKAQENQDEIDCESAFITLEEMPEPWKSLMEFSIKDDNRESIFITYREKSPDRVQAQLVMLNLTNVPAEHPILQHPDIKKPIVIGRVTSQASFSKKLHGKYCMNLLHTYGRTFSTPISLGLHHREMNWTFIQESSRPQS
jgi:hypothetical protein